MQLSFNLIAAVAILLPSLIAGAPIANDGLAARDLELTARDAFAVQVANMKREAYAEAGMAGVEHLQAALIMARAHTQKDLDNITAKYKAAQSKCIGALQKYKKEKDWAKKEQIAKNTIYNINDEIQYRIEAEEISKDLGKDKETLRKHAIEIRNKQSCLRNWETKRDHAKSKKEDATNLEACEK